MHSDGSAPVLRRVSGSLETAGITRYAHSSRRCRVLVVDDDEFARARIAGVLRNADFDVDAAATAADALRIMHDGDCQILLTDWQMPDMDGLALCRNVRQAGSDRYVYVLMHTVRDSQQDLLAGLAAGADDYLVKGVPVEQFVARMDVARRIAGLRSSSNRNQGRSQGIFSDALTGANNQRYLVKHLSLELLRSRRYEHPFAIINCCVDRFEQINDLFGREAGDELLRELVARVEASTRKGSDWLARVANDEFMIVLPETKVHGAHCVAQKLRESFVRAPVVASSGLVHFTVSIGITAYEPTHNSNASPGLEDMLLAVGRGMAASKNRGGNRVTAAAATSGVDIAVGSLQENGDAIH